MLFWGENALRDLFVQSVVGAPQDAAPLTAVAAGLEMVGYLFSGRPRDQSRQRQSVIAANPALQERESIKLAHLAATFPLLVALCAATAWLIRAPAAAAAEQGAPACRDLPAA